MKMRRKAAHFAKCASLELAVGSFPPVSLFCHRQFVLFFSHSLAPKLLRFVGEWGGRSASGAGAQRAAAADTDFRVVARDSEEHFRVCRADFFRRWQSVFEKLLAKIYKRSK